MSNRELVQLLRSGRQTPVKLVFNNIRTTRELADRIGQQLELEPDALLHLLEDNDYLQPLGFKCRECAGHVPAGYLRVLLEYFGGSVSPTHEKGVCEVLERFAAAEGEADRTTTSGSLHPASIVQQETNRNDEKPIIAGVYLNRLKRDAPGCRPHACLRAWGFYHYPGAQYSQDHRLTLQYLPVCRSASRTDLPSNIRLD